MINFCNFSEDFLLKSSVWLKDPEIKKLTMTPDFTKESQKIFFESLNFRNDYKIFGVCFSEEKIGVCGLKNIDNKSGEYWGYIGNKSYWGLGCGTKMLNYIEELAREIELKKVYLKVSKENSRAISLYGKNGYSLEDDIENFLFMAKYL